MYDKSWLNVLGSIFLLLIIFSNLFFASLYLKNPKVKKANERMKILYVGLIV